MRAELLDFDFLWPSLPAIAAMMAFLRSAGFTCLTCCQEGCIHNLAFEGHSLQLGQGLCAALCCVELLSEQCSCSWAVQTAEPRVARPESCIIGSLSGSSVLGHSKMAEGARRCARDFGSIRSNVLAFEA